MASSAKPPPIVINGDKPFISEPTGPVSPMPKAAPSFTISEATPISSPMVNDGVTPGDSSNATLSESRRSQKEDIWSELLCEPPHLWLEERRNAQQDTASYIIRATSVNRLLYQIVLDFPEEDRGRHRNLNEYTLPSTFLMVHRWVVSSCSLFIRIARLYQGPSASVLADSISAASTPLPASSLGAASDTSSRHSHSRTASASGADGFALSSSGGAARHSRTPSRNSVESYGGAPSTAASDDVSPLPPYASSVTGSDGMATGGCPLSQWSHVSPQELVADADLLRKFRSRAVRVLRYWLESQPNDFVDEAVSFQLDAFMEELRANEPSLAAMLAESRQVAFSTLPQTTAARVQTTASPSLVNFQSADASLLAAQFTVLEFDYYRNIRPLEFFVSSSRDFNGRVVSPNLFLSIQHFNRISFWVVAMILSETDTQRRALVFGKLIRIARKLRGLKNYNTLMAFFAGFKHNAIHRLKETFDALPRKLQSALSDLGDFLTPEHNFEQYRRDVDAQRDFCIPYLGLTLTDLTHISDALWKGPGVEAHMFNFQRLSQMSHVIRRALQFQSESLSVERDATLLQVLRATLFPVVTESELYELSLLREPRHAGHRRTVSARRRSLSDVRCSPQDALFKFLLTFYPVDDRRALIRGNAIGQTAPSREDYKKSVAEMVAAIVGTFDTTKSRALGKDEFARLASFFPFLPPFQLIDTDQNGSVSEQELVQFFLYARNVLAPCENHRFLQETNIGAGTQRCSGCHRVLFGISGKYLRCESCGVMVHTRCAPRPAAAISSEWSPVSLPGMPPTATELPPASSSATSATSATSAAAAVALLSVSEDGDSARSKSPTPAPPSFGEETPVSTPKKGAWLWPFHKGGGRAQEH